MSFIPFKQWFYVGAVCAGSVLLTTGCVDSDYDLETLTSLWASAVKD